MVSGHSQVDQNGTRSWGTAISGQSVSTSGSIGSPSCRSEARVTTPARENTVLRLSHLEIHGDDTGSPDTVASKKKKRGQRATGSANDKNGRGLRQFSMKVCEKVERRGRTTYNEVADALVAEYASLSDDQQGYDEKNIRRRVYDALNVLMAMDIISKDKKEIQWKGLPRTGLQDIEELKKERIGLKSRIEKKAAYLQELEEQLVGYQNLVLRNQRVYGNGNAPTGGVSLPFILVQTRPNATVEVEISEDMHLVHFDFNSTPFELHDDNYVLKQMEFCGSTLDGAPSSHPITPGEDLSTNYEYKPQKPHPPSPPNAYQPQNPQPHSPPNSSQPQIPLSSSRSNTPMKTPYVSSGYT